MSDNALFSVTALPKQLQQSDLPPNRIPKEKNHLLIMNLQSSSMQPDRENGVLFNSVIITCLQI